MGKFVIECPKCGRYNQASTSIFSNNYIECACGNLINVRKDRLQSKVCSHCGNNVVYDQAKRDTAICPICKEKLFNKDDMKALVEISCPTCACVLSVNKNAKEYKCPVCDAKIDVQHQIKIEELKKQSTPALIKYEGGNDVFVWKHPVEDFNWGTQLIVHESQEAIFFRDGEALDLFGSGKYTLETEKLPLINKMYKVGAYGSAFHSEVYFINLTTQLGIKWGTDNKVRLLDPYSGLHIELGACGTCGLKIVDSRKFLVKVVGTTSGATQEDLISNENLSAKFKPTILNKVKTYLPKTIKENDINVLEIDEHLEEISEVIQAKINDSLKEYGLMVTDFAVLTIQTPDEDPNFRKLKEQHAARYLKVQEEQILKMEANVKKERKIVEAETEAAETVIKAKAEADAYKLKAEAEAEEMKMKGYTYEQETQRQVATTAVNNQSSTGNTISSVVTDAVSVGVGLGVVKEVVKTVKESLDTDDTWECKNCNTKGLKTNFCPNCGAKKE